MPTRPDAGRGTTDFGGKIPEGGATRRGGGLNMGSQMTLSEMAASQEDKPASRFSPETLQAMKVAEEYTKDELAKEAKAKQEQPEESAQSQSEQEAPAKKDEVPEREAPVPDAAAMADTLPGVINPFANEKRRKEIEARCDDLSFDGLLKDGELQQSVPIREGTLVVVYRSHSLDEDMFIKGRIYTEGRDGLSQSHLQSLISVYNLVLGLVSINGVAYVTHLNPDGTINEKGFTQKLSKLNKLPAILIGDLAVNLAWFQERLQNLVTAENIKNG